MEHNILGLKELRRNTERYIAEVKKGKSFIVMRRSKPVFRISQPEDESAWEPIIDLTKLRKGGVALTEVLARL